MNSTALEPAQVQPSSSTNQADQSVNLTTSQVAEYLGVSESWVRRHIAELPAIRVGRLIRFNSLLLSKQLQGTISNGKSLKLERANMVPNSYQRGYVFTRGKSKVWYGMFREDVRMAEGMERRQRMVRLGAFSELSTKNAARNKLAEILGSSSSTEKVEMSFLELTDRWKTAEGPTLKTTTFSHYTNTLRAYVLPVFGNRRIASINREDIQTFLAEKAKTYSTSTLRRMRAVLGLTLGWANACGWIPKNPCVKVKLPKNAGGRRVNRTVLQPTQITAIASRLEEPYATLVLFLAATGLRIGEAIAVKWTDFQGNVLQVSRRICDGDVDAVKSLKSVRKLPLDAWLLERIRGLGADHEWVFRSEAGTPVNPGNALKRYVRPAAEAVGVKIGGWHDFRHTLSTGLRRSGVHPKVVSDILGHSRVSLAMDVYDRTDVSDFELPLAVVAKGLLSSVIKSEAAA